VDGFNSVNNLSEFYVYCKIIKVEYNYRLRSYVVKIHQETTSIIFNNFVKLPLHVQSLSNDNEVINLNNLAISKSRSMRC